MRNYIITCGAFLVPVLFFISSPAVAQQLEASKYIQHAQPATAMQLTMEYCPQPSALQQSADKLWGSPDGWKSSSPSFLKKVHVFVGARWVGVNLGEIICTYSHSVKAEFPLNLHRPLLITSPTGGKWGVDEGGHKICKSNDPKDCPFYVQKPVGVENIYEDLDFFKNQPVESFDDQP